MGTKSTISAKVHFRHPCSVKMHSSIGGTLMIKRVAPKTLAQMTLEWDEIAEFRAEQLRQHIDITYDKVLVPNILREIRHNGPILDAGGGVGALLQLLTATGRAITYLDPSEKSLSIARSIGGPGPTYVRGSVESLADTRSSLFSTIIANMVLINAPDLNGFLHATYTLLAGSGSLIATITHPCFWPGYRGYHSEPWFTYQEEIFIEAPFRITNMERCEFVTTHIHRPLEMYFEAFSRNHLIVREFKELMPDTTGMSLYPAPWSVPRYILLVLERGPAELTLS